MMYYYSYIIRANQKLHFSCALPTQSNATSTKVPCVLPITVCPSWVTWILWLSVWTQECVAVLDCVVPNVYWYNPAISGFLIQQPVEVMQMNQCSLEAVSTLCLTAQQIHPMGSTGHPAISVRAELAGQHKMLYSAVGVHDLLYPVCIELLMPPKT